MSERIRWCSFTHRGPSPPIGSCRLQIRSRRLVAVISSHATMRAALRRRHSSGRWSPLQPPTTGPQKAFANQDGTQPIQRANAAFRWSGSWLTVTVGVDPAGAETLSSQLRADVLSYLDRVRLAGYDLEVTGATYVPIDLAIGFCIATGFFVGNVEQGIQQVLSNRDLAGGGKGFFHPDNFSFGDDLYVSRLHAAVMSVAGVESARITRLARLHVSNPDADTRENLRQGFLAVGSNEIIQLDNDRNFPERGVIALLPLE